MTTSTSKKKTTTTKVAASKTVTKAAFKKAPVKKVVAKKSTATKAALVKKAAQKVTEAPLVYADNERSFWVSDGNILNSLQALHDALATMDVAVYQIHARPDQNDFAVWVEQVLCDEACAAALSKAKTPTAAKTVVARHLKVYAV